MTCLSPRGRSRFAKDLFSCVLHFGFLYALGCTTALGATSEIGKLEAGFRQPPPSARPWVYWFWVGGNITSNGITADLEAMQRVGIGGVLIMDVDQGTPKGPVGFNTPQWRLLFQHACADAHRLGLQINLNDDAGWCGSGGPWVTPELSMQKVVWTETHLHGSGQVKVPLARPEAVKGFYRDIAVLAFPTLPGDETDMNTFAPTFSTSDEPGGHQGIVEGTAKTAFVLSRPSPGKPAWVQMEFPHPYTARELTLRMGLSGDQICHGLLQTSEDGKTFRDVQEFAAEARKMVLDFPAVTARYFRLLFRRQHPDLKEVVISDLELSPRLRIAHMEGKACFSHQQSYPGPNEFPGHANYPAEPNGFTIGRGAIVDLTANLGKDGQFSWNVPPGAWTVLRLGHTSTGTDNHPAREGGLGLECDKLRKEGIQAVFNGWVGQLARDAKAEWPGTLVSAHVDSWEVDSQNWTENFRAEFRRRRGYDLLPFLPVLTGRVIESFEISERFLWDFRQTIADLLAENYAGELRRLAHSEGLRFSLEGYDAPCDDLTYASRCDEPMAEFWTWPPFEMDYTCAAMASVAHVYGRPIAGVEAFTATRTERWLAHPFTAKAFGDWAFCEGLNRLVIHRFTHQPWTDPERDPGVSMGPFGLHYERTQTWWNESGPWHEYLSRCQYLLRQGHYVADICYLEPQDVPQHWKVPYEARGRVGYDFDVCPPDAVLNRMSVKGGRIVLPDGMSYRVLALPNAETMTPELLAKIRQMVKAGATVVGNRPQKSPSLSDYPKCDREVKRMTDDIWAKGQTAASGEHRFGKGKVIWGKTAQQTLTEADVPPDFAPVAEAASAGLRYIHRRLPDAELYFVSNQKLVTQETVCEFRVSECQPELWWPDTGRTEHVALYDSSNGTTRLPLRLGPAGSVFVLFRKSLPAQADRIVALSRNGKPLVNLRHIVPVLELPEPVQTNSPAQTPRPGLRSSTFTMAVWAKPAVDIPLPREANSGQDAFMMERNDALFPPPGHEVFGGPEHAGAGLSIGRNGVCVFEHAPFYFPPILVFATPVTNWTHVAVVYEDGRPKLYLNGKLVHEGLQSTYIVHSGVDVSHRRGTAPYEGALGAFRGFNRALSGRQVAELMTEMPVPMISSALPVAELKQSKPGDSQAQVWEPGMYVAETAKGEQRRFAVDRLPEPIRLAGAWELSFPRGRGAPEHVRLDHLISWSEAPDPGVRHFSGTAVYRKQFTVPAEPTRPGQRVFLDLGHVGVLARAKLNGHDLGILWKPPFRTEVTDALVPGRNELEVAVVNLWVNRLIGDAALPADSERNPDGTLKQWPAWLKEGGSSPTGRYTFATWDLWKGNEELRPSGLLGPVQLVTTEEVPVAGGGPVSVRGSTRSAKSSTRLLTAQ